MKGRRMGKGRGEERTLKKKYQNVATIGNEFLQNGAFVLIVLSLAWNSF